MKFMSYRRFRQVFRGFLSHLELVQQSLRRIDFQSCEYSPLTHCQRRSMTLWMSLARTFIGAQGMSSEPCDLVSRHCSSAS